MNRKVTYGLGVLLLPLAGLFGFTPAASAHVADCDPTNSHDVWCSYANGTFDAPSSFSANSASMPRNQCVSLGSEIEHSYTNQLNSDLRLYGSHLCNGTLRATAGYLTSSAVPAGYTYGVRLACTHPGC